MSQLKKQMDVNGMNFVFSKKETIMKRYNDKFNA